MTNRPSTRGDSLRGLIQPHDGSRRSARKVRRCHHRIAFFTSIDRASTARALITHSVNIDAREKGSRRRHRAVITATLVPSFPPFVSPPCPRTAAVSSCTACDPSMAITMPKLCGNCRVDIKTERRFKVCCGAAAWHRPRLGGLLRTQKHLVDPHGQLAAYMKLARIPTLFCTCE